MILFLFIRVAMFFLNGFKNVLARPARFVIFNSVMISTLCAIFAVLSGTGYFAAYRALIPTVQVERDVHFKYAMRPCKLNDHCQHPVAEVWLGDDPAELIPVLSPGTEYRIELNLELPESSANFDVGMFMATVELQTPQGQVLRSAQRSGVLVYRSSILRMLHTMLALPSLLLGSGQEKQLVRLPMFDSFVDQPHGAHDFAAIASIELHSTDIQIYSAKLRIYADFGGLRYMMYRWPLTSALFGFGVNFTALWVMMSLFWIRSRIFTAVKLVKRKISSSPKNEQLDSVTLRQTTEKTPKVAEVNGITHITDEDEVAESQSNSRVAKITNILEKFIARLPLVSSLRPYAASLLNFGLRWSPVPVPKPVVTFAQQVVGTHKCKLS